MQCVAHEGEGSGVGVEGAHEAKFYGVTLGRVGRLYVWKIVQSKAATFIEAYAADAKCIGRWLGLEDDGLAMFLDECFEGFTPMAK